MYMYVCMYIYIYIYIYIFDGGARRGSRVMWTFYYGFTNYPFKRSLNIKRQLEFHPSGNIWFQKVKVVFNELILGELILKSPYRLY